MKNLRLHRLLGVAAAGLMLFGMVTSARATVIGSETLAEGFIGDLFGGAIGSNSTYLVASDGESTFEPWGVNFDVSDGLNFSDVGYSWSQAAGSQWTAIGTQTWVLPADLTSLGCGQENEPSCEPAGHFISPSSWAASAIGTWDILDAAGALSDRIITFNDAGGNANVLFYSDPSLVPLPAALPLFATGLGGLGLLGWRRKRRKIAAIAA
jgi:hypothetical protein